MASESKQSAVKMKPRSSNFDGSKGKIEASMKVKRIESSIKQKQPVVDSKQKSVSAVTTKTEVWYSISQILFLFFIFAIILILKWLFCCWSDRLHLGFDWFI